MLSEDKLKDLREHLEKAQNPLFLYDNDADGFCSFILLRKFIGAGKGVAVRTYPDIDVGYVRKIQEFNADYVFVLDRPFLGEAFVREVESLGVPIVWIDHHEAESVFHSHPNVHVFNPTLNKIGKSSEPVTYICHKATEKAEDMWIAMMGCISDHYLPDFSKDFAEQYPEMWSKKKIAKPFDAYYGTEIGRFARAVGFGLKDSITHVVYMQNFIVNAKGPQDMVSELESSSSLAKKYKDIWKKYEVLLERSKECVGKKLVFFQYAGTLSISAELSNELSYLYPKQVIAVVYNNGSMSNISLRGRDVRKMFEKIVKHLDGGSGGGHEEAVGGRIKTDDVEKFKNLLEKELE